MKKILLTSLLLLALTACGNQPSTDTVATQTVTPVDNVPMDVKADATIDATTAATSKSNQVSFNGTIVLPPNRLATVALTLGGVVRNTSLIPGQRVAKGALLATLENPDFINLQQTYLESQAQVLYLKAEYERQTNLAEQQAASQKKLQQSQADYLSMKSRFEAAAAQLLLLNVDLDQLKKDGIQPLLHVQAPIGGYVAQVAINVGKYINPGESLCQIIDKTAPLLKLTTYEKDLVYMHVGSDIEFRVNGMGTRTFKAILLSVGQQVDEVNRSVEVYARILDVDAQFRPGMYVTARVQK